MKIVTLGTGGCFPNPRRSAPATVVLAADRWILVDAGENVGPRLVESGIPPEDLAAVLLTHYHADHTAGLAPLLLGLHVARQRTAPLLIGGGPSLGRLRRGLAQAFGDWLLNPCFPLQWTEYDPPGELAFGSDLTVRYEEVIHTEAHRCLGYRFACDGKVLAVSGDTIACDGLRRLILQADLLLCEAGYPDDEPVPGHLTPAQIAAIANGAGVKKIVLTHFAEDRLTERLTAAVQADFAGQVSAARDGEAFVIE